MGFYGEWVLPRLTEWSLGTGTVIKQRKLTLAGVHGTVLEIGMGSGLNLPLYPPEVTRVIAVEPSSGMNRLAAPRVAEAPFPVEYVGFDEEGRYPLADGSVDAVVSTWTLCTIPRPERALAEFRRVLRPGGRFHFLEHGAGLSPRVRRWQTRLNPIQNVLGGGCNLNREIDRLVEQAGFSDVAIERFWMKRTPRLLGELYRGTAVN